VIEAFLETARQQVAARTATGGDGYGRETDLHPAIDGLVEAAEAAIDALTALHRPLAVLRARLVERLADEAEDLDTALRVRIESLARSIQRRALLPLAGWQAMLRAVGHPSPDEHVDWVAIDRADGRDADVALRRHWVDPTIPLAAVLAEPVHGLLVTSATLADTTGDAAHDWAIAEQRTGAAHLPKPAVRVAVSSPFDYGRATRVLVVNDVRKDDLGQVAGAYRALIRAAGGGTLGLFTAISRLREVHRRIAPTLEEMGLPLYAQHVDAMETGTLIDVFRAEVDASLLGTDAVRDGVDVPGRSLRLIVFDRVPWPRPDILHRARRTRFGGRDDDDRLARLRLKQAFGRLIRRADDRGVFVLLDPMMPSRLAGAFPAAAPFQRVGLTEATDLVRGFLTPG
jgi:ATP-dependent DNA helicase DinG